MTERVFGVPRPYPYEPGRVALLVVDHDAPAIGTPTPGPTAAEWSARRDGIRPQLRRLAGAVHAASGPVLRARGPFGGDLFGGSGSADVELVVDARASVFWSANAAAVLSDLHVNHLLVAGIRTNAAVLINAVDSTNFGLYTTVVEDACAAESAAIHNASLALMESFYARLATDEVISRLAPGAASNGA